MNWCEVEYILLKTLRLQPSELDRMEFWRAEVLLEIHKQKVEEENKQRKKQEEQQSAQMPNMSGIMGQQQSMLGNLTKGAFKPPKL
jgi:hypothetical protein